LVDGAAYVVKDSNGQKLDYVYYEEEPGGQSAAKLFSKDEARRNGSPDCHHFIRGAAHRRHCTGNVATQTVNAVEDNRHPGTTSGVFDRGGISMYIPPASQIGASRLTGKTRTTSATRSRVSELGPRHFSGRARIMCVQATANLKRIAVRGD